MFLLEKKILDSVVEFIYEKISLETAKKSGYEKLEYDIETMMIEIALLLFQKIINGIDLIEGHSEKLEIKIENKIKIFLKNSIVQSFHCKNNQEIFSKTDELQRLAFKLIIKL
ncbi:MAG TPA: hypothetical protein PKY81_11320 [bacterium]|nr:hypothetical protein [bacterium]